MIASVDIEYVIQKTFAQYKSTIFLYRIPFTIIKRD